MYIKVIVPLGLNDSYTYKCQNTQTEVGDLVKVNFAGKTLLALVAQKLEDIRQQTYHIKSAQSTLKIKCFDKKYVQFIRWVSDYYMTKIGLIFKSAIVKEIDQVQSFCLCANFMASNNAHQKLHQKIIGAFAKKNVVSIFELLELKIKKTSVKKMLDAGILSVSEDINIFYKVKIKKSIQLSSAQSEIAKKILIKGFNVYLLDGVTGSGKTAIYLDKIASLIEQDQCAQALVMLPEISLTSYIVSKIEQYFDNSVEIVEWHCRLSKNKRAANWHKIASGSANIIVAARSGIFLPIPNLKIIVVDEEHDTSFKQDQGEFTYNARDAAIVRSKLLGIPIILCSATPALESINNVSHKNYLHLKLQDRFDSAKMPTICVTDMRSAQKETKYLSKQSISYLKKNIEKGKQSLIFLNKRGYARLVLCQSCGHRIKCPNCSMWMVEHKRRMVLVCHMCCFSTEKPTSCPSCNLKSLISFGPGIEKIEEEVKKIFKNKKIITISSDLKAAESFHAIEENDVDIIIGTQIVSKGYDFANLTLLIIVDADSSIHGGDLRAGEKKFQVLQQAIGRIGRRKSLPGKAILQTYTPDDPLINALKTNNRDLFYQKEIENRKQEFMPPFSRLGSIVVSGIDKEEVEFCCRQLAKSIINKEEVQIFGPAPAPIEFLNNRHRYRFLIICNKKYSIQNYIQTWLSKLGTTKNIKIQVDIDPINFL